MLHRGLRILNKNGNDLKQQISSKYIRKYGIDAIEKVVGKDAVNRLVNSIDDIKSIVSSLSVNFCCVV